MVQGSAPGPLQRVPHATRDAHAASAAVHKAALDLPSIFDPTHTSTQRRPFGVLKTHAGCLPPTPPTPRALMATTSLPTGLPTDEGWPGTDPTPTSTVCGRAICCGLNYIYAKFLQRHPKRRTNVEFVRFFSSGIQFLGGIFGALSQFVVIFVFGVAFGIPFFVGGVGGFGSHSCFVPLKKTWGTSGGYGTLGCTVQHKNVKVRNGGRGQKKVCDRFVQKAFLLRACG